MSSSVGSLTRQSEGDQGPISAAYAPSKSFLNAVTVQYARELARWFNKNFEKYASGVTEEILQAAPTEKNY